MKDFIDKIGGRKFSMTMGCGIVCTGLVLLKSITGSEFVTLILGTVGAYITGDVAHHWVKKEGKNDSKLPG